MKKILFTTLLALIIALASNGSAFAQKNKINLNGEVLSKNEDGTLTVQSKQGGIYVVVLPAGINASAIQVGASVLVKGQLNPDGSVQVASIKLLGVGETEEYEGEEVDDEGPGGFQENSAFCAEGKQERPHPLAPKLAARYGVDEGWVMEKICAGYSIGAIMLAIKTSQVVGIQASADDLLAERASGMGWGQIWQKMKLIGSEKEGHSPPGQLKKQMKAGGGS